MLTETSPFKGLMNRSSQEAIPAAITDIGCEREINEDRYAVLDCDIGRAWIVCDGMGGVVGGELAAQLAIDAIRGALQAGEYETASDALSISIEEANRRVVLRRQNPAFAAMGTTVVLTVIAGDEVVIGHVGDSRAYLVRNGAIQQLTTDHTYVQDLVERGVITPAEALSHPQAHVLTRCLGAEPRLETEATRFWIWPASGEEPNDKIVLCTDGLYSLISDDEICEAVSKMHPQEACAQLVEVAKSRGGYDNITVAVLPLDGQLREEAPSKPRSQSFKRKKAEAEPDETPFSFGRRITVMFLMALIGSVITALLTFWKLSVMA